MVQDLTLQLEETKGDSVEKQSASLPNTNEKASVKRVLVIIIKSYIQDAEEKATNNSEKKAHSTTYFGPDGKERTFIQARERRLALDRDVGKRKVLYSIIVLYRLLQTHQRKVKLVVFGAMCVNVV